MESKTYWENEYKFRKNDDYDDWLEKYKSEIESCKTKVLDLGSGLGNDTAFLLGHGKRVLAVDISKTALEKLKEQNPNAETLQLDISKPLPFPDNSFDLVVANLSLHYFDTKTTKKIINEIKRILTSGGKLIARLNSKNDKNHGYGIGTKLEENFFLQGDIAKRFFDTNSAIATFKTIGTVDANEVTKLRFGKPRMFVELIATKN